MTVGSDSVSDPYYDPCQVARARVTRRRTPGLAFLSERPGRVTGSLSARPGPGPLAAWQRLGDDSAAELESAIRRRRRRHWHLDCDGPRAPGRSAGTVRVRRRRVQAPGPGEPQPRGRRRGSQAGLPVGLASLASQSSSKALTHVEAVPRRLRPAAACRESDGPARPAADTVTESDGPRPQWHLRRAAARGGRAPSPRRAGPSAAGLPRRSR